MKKFLTALALVVAISLVISTPLMSKTVIKHWAGGSLGDFESIIIKMFEKRYPEIKVVPEYIPVGNMQQKVMIAIAADDTPDTLIDYFGRISSWWGQGALESLNGTLSKKDVEDFPSSLLELMSIDGNLVGYPTTMGARTFGANVTLLEKAGVANLLPKGDNYGWSLKDFETAAKKVSQLDGVYGTGFFCANPSGDYHMLGWFQSFGAYLYQNGDYTKTTLNYENGVKALEWMIDMVEKGYATPGPAGTTDDHHVEAFWSGKIAFGGWVPTPQQAEGNYKSGMINYLPKYRLLEFPHVEGVAPPPVFIGMDVLCLFKNSKVKEEAIKWMQYRTNRLSVEIQLEYFSPSVPARKSVPVEVEHIATVKKIIEHAGVGDLGLASPNYVKVRNLQYPELQAAFTGAKTAKQALDDFAKAVSELWK